MKSPKEPTVEEEIQKAKGGQVQEVTDRPAILLGKTLKTYCGCGNIYITVTEYKDKPFEVFITLGKNGDCAATTMAAIGVLISHALRTGSSLQVYADAMMGFMCPRSIPATQNKGIPSLSCVDAVARALNRYINGKPEPVATTLPIEDIQDEPPSRPWPSVSHLIEKPVSIPIPTESTPIIAGSKCDECGAPVVMSEGCEKCIACGHSQKCHGN